MFVAAPTGTMVTAIAASESGRRCPDDGGIRRLGVAPDSPTSTDSGRGRVASFISRSGIQVVFGHDVYVLTRSDRINLKVRHPSHRENSLKLKRLVERTDDGFERWRTEFDAPLPAGPERLRDVLDLIGRAGSPERLGGAARGGEVVEILDTICDRHGWLPCTSRARCFRAEPVALMRFASGPGGQVPFPGGSRAAATTTFPRAGPGQAGLAVQLRREFLAVHR
jgi:hypothetical protein